MLLLLASVLSLVFRKLTRNVSKVYSASLTSKEKQQKDMGQPFVKLWKNSFLLWKSKLLFAPDLNTHIETSSYLKEEDTFYTEV